MAKSNRKVALEKSPSGIQGLDEITSGGLPKGRPILVCGAAGSGKTLFAMEFLVRGAIQYGEPGVFMSFEETEDDLAKNVASLGFDLPGLVASKRLLIDYVHLERSEIEETGEYDLEGLFIRLGHAIDSIGAKRVALDTVESLFGGLPNHFILRSELRRLFRWLKEKGMTAIITGEKGENTLTRHGLEEYVSDCVIFLDHRVSDQISTRRLRIVKYRGSTHDTSEFPFLIDEKGISVMPITSIGLKHLVTSKRISSGIPRLDTMLEDKGYFRGSSILVSGMSGTGKTTVAASLVDAACRRGEHCVYFAFEESASQIVRNMRSVGIDLEQWVKKGLLGFHVERPTALGLETHLARMHKAVEESKPTVAVVDPISNLISVGTFLDIKGMLTRLIDYLKMNRITTLLTSLTASSSLEETEQGVSSLADTWILLRSIEIEGERNRGLNILKSRGMAHSNQMREFLLTDQGVQLVDVYLGPQGVLTGTARAAQQNREAGQALASQREVERMQRALERKRKALGAQIAALRAEFEAEGEEMKRLISEVQTNQKSVARQRTEMGRIRGAD